MSPVLPDWTNPSAFWIVTACKGWLAAQQEIEGWRKRAVSSGGKPAFSKAWTRSSTWLPFTPAEIKEPLFLSCDVSSSSGMAQCTDKHDQRFALHPPHHRPPAPICLPPPSQILVSFQSPSKTSQNRSYCWCAFRFFNASVLLFLCRDVTKCTISCNSQYWVHGTFFSELVSHRFESSCLYCEQTASESIVTFLFIWGL